jgi:hypothetical protein
VYLCVELQTNAHLPRVRRSTSIQYRTSSTTRRRHAPCHPHATPAEAHCESVEPTHCSASTEQSGSLLLRFVRMRLNTAPLDAEVHACSQVNRVIIIRLASRRKKRATQGGCRDMMAMAVGLSAVMLCSVAALSAPCPEPIHGTDFLNEDHQDSADATDYASCCRCNFFSHLCGHALLARPS